MTSGPRFALVFLWYILTQRPGTSLPKFVFGVGIFRTLTCGGWTYVTSTDDHNWHDIFMISYLIATLPWTLGCIALSPKANQKALKYRKYLAGSFFGTLVPLIYFFIQHKVHKVAGAYTTYAFFEWALILLDVGFDACTALDFQGFELIIRDVHGASRGYVYWLPKYSNVRRCDSCCFVVPRADNLSAIVMKSVPLTKRLRNRTCQQWLSLNSC